MSTKKPDNIVYSENEGYNAALLPYSTSVGAPVIKIDDVVSWKSSGIRNVNKEFENKFDELRVAYEKLMQEYEWNEIIYGAKYSFEPVIGDIYHLYRGADGLYFLSLIDPSQWNKEFIGSFKLNSSKKWVQFDTEINGF